jgi:hypothetical protein
MKEAYRLAVRMYHPDSNSKDKVGGCCWAAGLLAGSVLSTATAGPPCSSQTSLPTAVSLLAALLPVIACLRVCMALCAGVGHL